MDDGAGAYPPVAVTVARRKVRGFARFDLALFASQLGERVLKRLDEPIKVLWRHLDPGGRDGQAGGCLGRVLEAYERLAALDAGANAGELE